MALIDGIVRYYKLDSNSTDSTGGANGTDTSISYTNAGIIGNSATFNGISSKITATHPFGTGNISFSYAGWLYITGTQTRGEFLSMGNQGVVDAGIHFSLRTKSGGNDAVYIDYSDNAGFSTVARVTYNAWNFIAITKNGNSISVQINNNTAETFTKTSLNVTTNTMLFGDYGASLAFYNGRIDETVLWSTIKTSTEFTTLYNAGNGLTYPFTTNNGAGFLMMM